MSCLLPSSGCPGTGVGQYLLPLSSKFSRPCLNSTLRPQSPRSSTPLDPCLHSTVRLFLHCHRHKSSFSSSLYHLMLRPENAAPRRSTTVSTGESWPKRNHQERPCNL